MTTPEVFEDTVKDAITFFAAMRIKRCDHLENKELLIEFLILEMSQIRLQEEKLVYLFTE